MKFSDYIIDFIYPPRCCICGELIGYASKMTMCEKCRDSISYIDKGIDYSATLKNKFNIEIYFDCGEAVFRYSDVKSAIERFKYFGERNIGKSFAYLMYEHWKNNDKLKYADYLVSVPLNKARLKERGYNQAEYLANEFSKLTRIKHVHGAIKRIRDTKPQNLLDAKERVENVKNAFAVVNESIKGKTVLIIDDIFTTGSTINECAAALKKQGAAKVMFLTFSAAGNNLGSDKNV